MYTYRAQVLRVVDADTFHADIDLGCDCHTRQTIRLAGVNAPELSTAEGRAALAFVQGWMSEHAPAGAILLRTVKDRREKYGRYLGIVADPDDVRDLATDLLEAGHAVPYP